MFRISKLMSETWTLVHAWLSPSCFPAKMSLCLYCGIPSFFLILVFGLSMVFNCSTSRVMTFPDKVLMEICIHPQSLRTKWRVDSFWMLLSARALPSFNWDEMRYWILFWFSLRRSLFPLRNQREPLLFNLK